MYKHFHINCIKIHKPRHVILPVQDEYYIHQDLNTIVLLVLLLRISIVHFHHDLREVNAS